MGRAALVVSGGILLSRLLGFLRDVVLAAVLGATQSGDVYDAAFVLPDFLFYLVAGGYLAITFIPILSRYIADGDIAGGWKAFAAVFKPVAFLVVSLTLLALVFADRLVEAAYVQFPDAIGGLIGGAGDGLTPDQLDQVVTLTRIVLPAQIFFVLGALFMAVSYAHERFLIPTLAPIIYNAGIIAGGVVFRDSEIPATGFVWGALGGALVGNFLLQWWSAHRVGLRWARGVPLSHPAFREYLFLAVPLMLGQSLVVLEEQFIRIFAQFGNEGSIFALGRARRLNMLPVGVIAQAAGVAAYPFLARLAAEGRLRELSRTLVTALRYVIVASLVATATIVALAQPVVRVAFQRRNFTLDATLLTALALVFFGLSIAAWGAQQVYARGFYARSRMWTPVLAGTAASFVAVPLMLWMSQDDVLGVTGLALASSIGISGYALTLGILWHRAVGTEGLSGLLATLGRSAFAAGAAGAAGWKAADLVLSRTGLSFGGSLGAIGLGVTVIAAVYLALEWALRSPELRELAGRTPAG
jgi:putative peptidoglycan lipid II flippase